MITTIKLPIANAFLVRGERWVLVDSGAPGDGPAILRAMANHGVRPPDIALILLTHGHVDHFGGAAAVREATSAPIAIHHADARFLQAGRNPDELRSTGLEARLLRPFLPWSAPPVKPDILFDAQFDLGSFGLDATLIHTPGHSPGSVSLMLPDGSAIIGDLLRGGYMGGRLRGDLPNPPFYVDDPALLSASIAQVLAPPIQRLFVGHGGPLNTEPARRRLQSGALRLAVPQGSSLQT
jgi:hydroxyacylglutathione hydrolase